MKKFVWVVILAAVTGSVVAGIQQAPTAKLKGFAYVAWQGEEDTTNVKNYPARRYWADSTTQPAGASAYYGNGFLWCPEIGGDNINEKNYVTYDIKFRVPGSYLLYMRLAAFDMASNESNADSMWFQQKVGGFLVNNGGFVPENRIDDGKFKDDWNLLLNNWRWQYISPDNRIQVTQADINAGGGVYTFTLMVGAREGGLAIDAVVAVDAATGFTEVTRADLDKLLAQTGQANSELPASGSIKVSRTPTLSWKGHPQDPAFPDVIDSNTKKFNVYISNGTSDPNVYYKGEVPVSGTDVNASYAVTSPLNYDTVYFWQIEEVMSNGLGGTYPAGDPNNIRSNIWNFQVRPNNLPPVISAGEDIYTWLAVPVQLAGVMLQDDLQPQAATVTWSVVSEPNPANPAVITNPSALNAKVTVNELGTYILRLTADDTENQVTDDVIVNVYADACAAAKAVPGFVLLPGDIDKDCDVDLSDLSRMAQNWLENNALK